MTHVSGLQPKAPHSSFCSTKGLQQGRAYKCSDGPLDTRKNEAFLNPTCAHWVLTGDADVLQQSVVAQTPEEKIVLASISIWDSSCALSFRGYSLDL